MAAGCRRVNIGTAALEQPEWCAAGDRDLRRPGRGRARRAGPDPGGPRLDPRRAATSTTCWPASTPRAARATSSPTSTRTACCRAPTSTCCATSAPPPTARSSPRAASPSWPTSRRCWAWWPTGSRAPSSAPRSTRAASPSTDALALTLARRADVVSLAVRVIPCLDVDAGRVVKGVNFESCATPATRSSWPRRYDAEGADELTFLDISASHEGRATTMEIVSRTAEQVFIPLTVGGRRRHRSTTSTGCCAPAPTRSRSTPPRSAAPSWSPRSPTGSATRCWCSRSTPAGHAGAPIGLRGDHPRRAEVRRARRDRVGGPRRRAGRRRDPAQRDGRRRHPGRLRPRPDPRRTP